LQVAFAAVVNARVADIIRTSATSFRGALGLGAWQGAWQRNFAEQNGSELFRVLTPQSPPAEGMISKGALKGLRLNRSIRPQAQLVNKNDEKSAINNAQVTHAKCINTCRT